MTRWYILHLTNCISALWCKIHLTDCG